MPDETVNLKEPAPPDRRRLSRSREDRLVAGVCGGLGRHLGVDSLLVRLVFVLLALAGGLGVLLYLALAVLTPPDDRTDLNPRQTTRAGVEELGEQAKAAAAKVAEAFRGNGAKEAAEPHRDEHAGAGCSTCWQRCW